MAKAEIFAGNCGYNPEVEASLGGKICRPHINSECPAIHKMAVELTEVHPYLEISFRCAMPSINTAGHKHCTHAACPVPIGIFKAVRSRLNRLCPRMLQ